MAKGSFKRGGVGVSERTSTSVSVSGIILGVITFMQRGRRFCFRSLDTRTAECGKNQETIFDVIDNISDAMIWSLYGRRGPREKRVGSKTFRRSKMHFCDGGHESVGESHARREKGVKQWFYYL